LGRKWSLHEGGEKTYGENKIERHSQEGKVTKPVKAKRGKKEQPLHKGKKKVRRKKNEGGRLTKGAFVKGGRL